MATGPDPQQDLLLCTSDRLASARFAQLSSLAGIATGVATGGVTTGVTRYVAEQGEVRRAAPFISTGFAIVCVARALRLLSRRVLLATGQRDPRQRQLRLGYLDPRCSESCDCVQALAVAILNGRKACSGDCSAWESPDRCSPSSWGQALTVRQGLTGALVAACLAPALPALALGVYLAVRRRDDSLFPCSKPDARSLALLVRIQS